MAIRAQNMLPLQQTQLIRVPTNNLCTVVVSYWTVITVTIVFGPCCPPACAVLTDKQSSTAVPSMAANKLYTILLFNSTVHSSLFRHSAIVSLRHVSTGMIKTPVINETFHFGN